MVKICKALFHIHKASLVEEIVCVWFLSAWTTVDILIQWSCTLKIYTLNSLQAIIHNCYHLNTQVVKNFWWYGSAGKNLEPPHVRHTLRGTPFNSNPGPVALNFLFHALKPPSRVTLIVPPGGILISPFLCVSLSPPPRKKTSHSSEWFSMTLLVMDLSVLRGSDLPPFGIECKSSPSLWVRSLPSLCDIGYYSICILAKSCWVSIIDGMWPSISSGKRTD